MSAPNQDFLCQPVARAEHMQEAASDANWSYGTVGIRQGVLIRGA